MNTYGYGAGGPGPGPGPASAAAVWGHEHHSLDGGHHAGFLTRFLYNFCTAITTWLVLINSLFFNIRF